jgi:hypothetical protein
VTLTIEDHGVRELKVEENVESHGLSTNITKYVLNV